MCERRSVICGISGRGQVDDDGFPRQEAAIRSYAKAHDIKLVRLFQEKGVSGAKEITDRPAFVAMMEALHGDGIKLVLVESLGRLARDLMVQESILHDLKRHGFELIRVAEPDLCSDDPSRKLMRQIMGAFHEYEKQMIVVKLRGAHQRKKLMAGSCEGRKPYGSHPGESETLKRIQELHASARLSTAIAAGAIGYSWPSADFEAICKITIEDRGEEMIGLAGCTPLLFAVCTRCN